VLLPWLYLALLLPAFRPEARAGVLPPIPEAMMAESDLLPTAAAEQGVPPPEPFGPVPSERQLRWHELEMYAFTHFTVNTFTDLEWGEGTEDPNVFNPTALDCRQWARVCKEAGLRGIIVTAKHHDGFCLWPSARTDHSVRSCSWGGGKRDVVGELAAACRECGLKFGIYLSPWDRHEPTYGDSPRYNDFYLGQLRELLTNYGEVFEVWFDGACGEGPSGKRQVYDWDAYWALVRKLQPGAVIFSDAGPDVRWVGNEAGYAGETNWCLQKRDDFAPGHAPSLELLTNGQPDGTHWVPAECDVSIRPGWFYHAHQDDDVKSLDRLLDIYYASVGRNANLLLNLPPDRRGLIHERDIAVLRQLRRVLDQTFDKDLAKGKRASADNVRGGAAAYAASNVTDGDPETYWATDDGVTSASLEVDLGKPTTFDRLWLQEFVALGQRVEQFAIDTWQDGEWRELTAGTTIGYRRILRTDRVTTDKVRLRITKARACPTVSRLSLYLSPPTSPLLEP
jgi:alpha-L-fucosidase